MKKLKNKIVITFESGETREYQFGAMFKGLIDKSGKRPIKAEVYGGMESELFADYLVNNIMPILAIRNDGIIINGLRFKHSNE